jgi:male-specific lethal 2
MNAISLYITTSRLVFQNSEQNAQDLYRLLPYLRQSLCCVVCRNLLLEPYTPLETNCQHHVCKQCVGERKKLKPTCAGCKDYAKYDENTQLRILLQCYKNLCEYVKSQPMFQELKQQAEAMSLLNGSSTPNISNSFVELIEEGSRFEDSFKFSSGLSKEAYSILPCIYPTIPAAPAAAPNTQTA